MTVNITINADTLELTNVDGMTRIVCNDTEKKDKPESENDWIVRRKLKPQKWHGTKVKEGFYFMRLSVSQHWVLWHITEDTTLVSNHPDSSAQILGPITPDMFL